MIISGLPARPAAPASALKPTAPPEAKAEAAEPPPPPPGAPPPPPGEPPSAATAPSPESAALQELYADIAGIA